MEKKTLYGVDKLGGVKQWSVWSEGDTVFVEHGKLDGKLQVRKTVCKSKNVGRANETTPEQQASGEAQSKWNKQYDKYYRETAEEAKTILTEGVMLAQDYTKKPHFLDDEFYISPKLDGLRVKSVYKEGKVTWHSRGNKIYPVPEHLKEDLIKLHQESGYAQLDGEAYIHGVKLQKIQSCVKKTNGLTPQVTYQIFDIPSAVYDWYTRFNIMQSMERAVEGMSHINIVEQEYCTKPELDDMLHLYLEQGYEGIMIRNLGGEYLFQNKRSNDLLKYKLFKDSEALVISVTEDKLNEGVLLCKWGDIEVEMKMKGNHEFRSYENQLSLIGKWINFKYQDLTEDGVPSFAVGHYVRDCDETGSPIE